MAKSIFLIILLLTSTCAFSQSDFYYEVKLTREGKQTSKLLFVAYEIGGVNFIDTLSLSALFQSIKGLPQPVGAVLYTDNELISPTPVFLAKQLVKVTLKANEIIVEKDQFQEDYLYLTKNDRVRPNYFPLYAELNATNDTEGLKKLRAIFDSLRLDDIKTAYNYFQKNKNSLLSLIAFSKFAAFEGDYAKIEGDFESLPLWAKNAPDGKNIAAKIQGAKSTQIGTKAKAFSQKSSTDQVVNFESFKGKYVLLDFWASWCGPCRKEHPILIEANTAFSTKNFTIISVSLDADKNAWLRAIEKDKLTWTQLSDLKGQQNEIALKYGVQSIPANFLISPEGIIISKDIKGPMLKQTLEKVMNSK